MGSGRGNCRRALLLAAALSAVVCVVALAAPGDLDRTFGGDGKVTMRWLSTESSASSIALQANGKIVVAGEAAGRVALARLKPDGTLDRSFGGDGKKTSAFARGANDVAIQANGKIVVAADTYWDPMLALARYDADGTFDTTFGGDGKVKTAVSCPGCSFPTGSLSDLAIQPDGKIVAVGGAGDAENETFYLLVVRYLPDGTLDAGFGEGGFVLTGGYRQPPIARSVALQADGKIVVAGATADDPWSDGDFLVARYDADGTLDPTFGGDGWVRTDFGRDDGAADLVVQPDGKIVAVGGRGRWMAMTRYEPDGTLDTGFGDGGRVVTMFDSDVGVRNSFIGVALQATGKIVAVGLADRRFPTTAHGRFAVARYNPDGSPDATFSGDGRVMTRFAGPERFAGARDVVVQANGRIVVAGPAGGRAALARYRAG